MARLSIAIRAKVLPPWTGIADLATAQHGVISIAQLARHGISPSAVQRQVERGRLHPLHAGVYAVGHRDIAEAGRLLAATLAAGPSSAISHRSAAGYAGIHPMPPKARIDVIVPRSLGGHSRGIALHRTRRLPAEDVISVDGIPMTTIARTLVDLASVLGSEQLRRAFEEAQRLHLLDWQQLELVMATSNGRRGVGRLRALFEAQRARAPRARSNPEIRFFRLCESAELPLPEVNARVHGFEVDFLWRDRRLIVELDGSSFHDRPGQGERDRRRDVQLSLAGHEVHRFGTDRVYSRPQELLTEVRLLLEQRWHDFPPLSG